MIKKYTLTVDMPYERAIEVFRSNLDDMSRKGYSTSGNTVIYNSDHNGKEFSGEYKNGCFVVRETDISYALYITAPKHKISFEKNGEQTSINVKSVDSFSLVAFVLCIMFFIVFGISAVLAYLEGGGFALPIMAILMLVIIGAVAVVSVKRLEKTKISLLYMYKDSIVKK